MNISEREEILIVLHGSDPSVPIQKEHRLRLPAGAGIPDLLRELERESPAMCAEIRQRILRAAGNVLAYGRSNDQLALLKEQLAVGGPIIFPPEDPAQPTITQTSDPADPG